MTVLVALVLAALAFALVLYPLFRMRSRKGDSADDGEVGELYSRRDAIYSAIEELEFDVETGSLSREDYQDMDHKYKLEAVSILKQIDKAEKGEAAEDEIERQVQELRQARIKGESVEDEIERQVLELRQARVEGLICSSCGAGYSLKDKFCPGCGASLKVCPQCSAGYNEGDRFCRQCGASLSQQEAL